MGGGVLITTKDEVVVATPANLSVVRVGGCREGGGVLITTKDKVVVAQPANFSMVRVHGGRWRCIKDIVHRQPLSCTSRQGQLYTSLC